MTSGKHRIAWAITLMAVAVSGSDNTHWAKVTPSQSTAGSGIRHEDAQNTPPEYDLRAQGTYNGKFMSLMKSPCRPELSGYFGATSGPPIRVQFGFKIETLPLAPISKVISAIQDKVADEILSSEFPQICGISENRRRLSHATGFRFIPFEERPGKLWTMPFYTFVCELV
jgi:hypothetical protein